MNTATYLSSTRGRRIARASVSVGATSVGAEPTSATKTLAIGGGALLGAAAGLLVLGIPGAIGGAAFGGGVGYVATRSSSSPAGDPPAIYKSDGVIYDPKDAKGDAKPSEVVISTPDYAAPAPPAFSLPTTSDVAWTLGLLPSPSPWLPVSTVNSRARVAAHRSLPRGAIVTFIAQYAGPLRSAEDTGDEIKLRGQVSRARGGDDGLDATLSMDDKGPAYLVVAESIVEEHDVSAAVRTVEPTTATTMLLSNEQILTATGDGFA